MAQNDINLVAKNGTAGWNGLRNVKKWKMKNDQSWTLNFFNKKDFFAFFIKLITYFCTCPDQKAYPPIHLNLIENAKNISFFNGEKNTYLKKHRKRPDLVKTSLIGQNFGHFSSSHWSKLWLWWNGKWDTWKLPPWPGPPCTCCNCRPNGPSPFELPSDRTFTKDKKIIFKFKKIIFN